MERKVTNDDGHREPSRDDRPGNKLATAAAAAVVVALLWRGWSLADCVSLVELLVLLRGLARD